MTDFRGERRGLEKDISTAIALSVSIEPLLGGRDECARLPYGWVRRLLYTIARQIYLEADGLWDGDLPRAEAEVSLRILSLLTEIQRMLGLSVLTSFAASAVLSQLQRVHGAALIDGTYRTMVQTIIHRVRGRERRIPRAPWRALDLLQTDQTQRSRLEIKDVEIGTFVGVDLAALPNWSPFQRARYRPDGSWRSYEEERKGKHVATALWFDLRKTFRGDR